MKFNSQICTSRSQSERLLALGLKKETADCQHWAYTKDSKGNLIPKRNQKWFTRIGTEESVQVCGFMDATFIPAWSLHRLIEMMPKRIKNIKEDWDMCSHDITFMITEDLDVNYEEPFEDEHSYNRYFTKGNLYDKIVDSIAWLIKEGYFNKEYLEG